MIDGEGDDLGLLDNSGTGDEGGGDEGAIETFGEEIPGDEGAGDEGADQGGDEELGGGEGEDGQRQAIVKFTPDIAKKAIREITTANPEFAKKFPNFEKVVTRALYKDSRIQELGGLQAINELAEAVEVHGGIDGIEDLVAEVEASRDLENGFKAGDPKIIDGWAKDYPLGFKRLVIPAIDKLKTLDKDFYEAVVSEILKRVFEEYGVYSVVAALGEKLGALDATIAAGAIKEFNSLAKFLGDSKALAVKAKSGPTERDAELDEREANISKTDRDNFYASVRMDVNPLVTIQMNKLIRQYLPQGAKVRVVVANRLRREIQAETRRLMTSKADFSAKFEQLINGRDKDRTIRFLVSRTNEFLPRVVKQLLAEFGLTGKGAQNGARRNAGGAGGANRERQRSVAVNGRPKTSEVDFSKTDKARFLATMHSHGEAWGLDGKLHKW